MIAALLGNRWLSIGCRLVVGGLFVAAALPKIADPPAFAHAVWNYRLLPSAAVNAAALVLPWLELLAGAALVAGVWRRGAALVVAGLLALFSAALAWNIARGVPVDCGCFALPAGVPRSHAEQIAEMKWDLARDLALLAAAAQALGSRVGWKAARS
jgi:uncharacterized membrane protein YphA (DoxX/SURF4 family)